MSARIGRGKLPKGYIASPSEARERFLSHTRRTDKGCLEWTAQVIPWDGKRGGYGLAHTPKGWGWIAKTSAHRVAWMLFRGAIPKGLIVCHSCDNRLCVNVEHLFLGTYADNTQDMIAKGREPDCMRPKVTEAQVTEMRELRANGVTAAEIGRRFGVSGSRASVLSAA